MEQAKNEGDSIYVSMSVCHVNFVNLVFSQRYLIHNIVIYLRLPIMTLSLRPL